MKPLLEITNKDMVIAEKEEELRSTSEKLRRSEIFISDMSRKIEKVMCWDFCIIPIQFETARRINIACGCSSGKKRIFCKRSWR